MHKRPHATRPLGENDRLVFEALAGAEGALSAYEVLGRLRSKGVTAPPTVYRSLKRLTAEGRIHRLETLNAYVVCAQAEASEGCRHGAAGFAICDTCGAVTEFPCEGLQTQINDWAEQAAFEFEGLTLELHGRCTRCTQQQEGAQP